MAEDQVLADLQRTVEPSSDATEEESLAQLEALAKDHYERMEAIVQEFNAKRGALEAAIAARRAGNDQAAREAEITKIKEGLQPPESK